jgi:hypothetical protein
MKLAGLFLVALFCVALEAKDQNIDLTKWNYDTGYTFCLYSYAAYCPVRKIEKWNCKWCQHNETVKDFETVKVYESDGERVFIGFNKEYEQIVISFRGSSDIPNWIENLQAEQVSYPYCKGCDVHKGFYQTWLAMKDVVLQETWALHLKYPTYDIVNTGHSLGAAVSTLSSVEVKMNVTASAKVYNWNLGSPRVGNKKFADWYLDEAGIVHSQRVVHYKDIVPHLPPADIPFEFYHHIVQEVWEQQNVYVFELCSPSDGEDPNCSDSLTLHNSVPDHLTYFGLLEECLL